MTEIPDSCAQCGKRPRVDEIWDGEVSKTGEITWAHRQCPDDTALRK